MSFWIGGENIMIYFEKKESKCVRKGGKRGNFTVFGNEEEIFTALGGK